MVWILFHLSLLEPLPRTMVSAANPVPRPRSRTTANISAVATTTATTPSKAANKKKLDSPVPAVTAAIAEDSFRGDAPSPRPAPSFMKRLKSAVVDVSGELELSPFSLFPNFHAF